MHELIGIQTQGEPIEKAPAHFLSKMLGETVPSDLALDVRLIDLEYGGSMTQMHSNCPNCNNVIKDGIIRSNKIFSEKEVKLINKYCDSKAEAYCNRCGNSLISEARQQVNHEIFKLSDLLSKKAEHVVILTAHTPLNWNYKALGIVTGQTTTGTGVLAEFTSDFTDFFGVQSGAYNKKLAKGEQSCFLQLSIKAIGLGGNAVIAADIDYSDVGGLKGMLMVCMAGTAINLINTDILGAEKEKHLNEISDLTNKLLMLKSELG